MRDIEMRWSRDLFTAAMWLNMAIYLMPIAAQATEPGREAAEPSQVAETGTIDRRELLDEGLGEVENAIYHEELWGGSSQIMRVDALNPPSSTTTGRRLPASNSPSASPGGAYGVQRTPQSPPSREPVATVAQVAGRQSITSNGLLPRGPLARLLLGSKSSQAAPPAAEGDVESPGAIATADSNRAIPNRLPDVDSPAPVATSERFQTLPDFAVETVIAEKAERPILAMTFNEFGHIVAAQENGPLWIMLDTDNNGSFETERIYGSLVKNCHGILALSGSVYVVGEGPQGPGLYRLRDPDRDGVLDEATQLVGFNVQVQEHGPHGIALGPDGMLYLSVGNHATPTTPLAESSPVRRTYEGDIVPRFEDPNGHARGIKAPGGFILRTDIRGSRVEIFASGLRNSYDLAFAPTGELFTYDSDMESDIGATWYRPTRLYYVQPGAEFGWRSGWAKWPEYYLDAIAPVVETGRGSPTGMVSYQHTRYPEKYRNALFMGDWSEGRILAAFPTAEGASYRGRVEEFITGTPLNVTDLDVGPDGALYFATGGRGSRGGIFRITYLKGTASGSDADYSTDLSGADGSPTNGAEGMKAALQVPQLPSAWARQRVARIKRDAGVAWEAALNKACVDKSLTARERLQALRIARWVGPVPDAKQLIQISRDADPAVRALAAEFMGSTPGVILERLFDLIEDTDPHVRLTACAALAQQTQPVPLPRLEPLLMADDRNVAFAAMRLLQRQDPSKWRDAIFAASDHRVFLEGATALVTLPGTKADAVRVVEECQHRMHGYLTDRDFLDLMRVLQLAIGQGALQASDVPSLGDMLADEFPAQHVVLNRELVRLLVRLQNTSAGDRFFDYLEAGIPSEDRILIASHLALINSGWTREQKRRLLSALAPPSNAGNSIPGYLQNATLEFGKNLSFEELNDAIDNGAAYPNAALAAILRLPPKLGESTVQRLIRLDENLSAEDGEIQRRLKIAVIAMLSRDQSESAHHYLRQVYDEQPLRRTEVAIGLAENPGGKNWQYVVRSLPLFDDATALATVKKLQAISATPKNPEHYRTAILTGLRLGDKGAAEVIKLLEKWQGFAHADSTPRWEVALAAWQNWFRREFPSQPEPVLQTSNASKKWLYEGLLSYLQTEGRQAGSVERGRQVFVKSDCSKCHRMGSLGESLGPDLTALARRFSMKEILDSILYPSQVISDQYAAQTVITASGKSYTGLIGSASNGDLTVLTTAGDKVFVSKDDLEELVPSKISAMPEGLLNSLTREDIADLMAYLQAPPDSRVTRQPTSANK